VKRSKTSSRAMRNQRNATKGITKGNSLYAQKINRGNQMYGPGCCAHKLTMERMNSIRAGIAREERQAA
jgi:hypothetical protein